MSLNIAMIRREVDRARAGVRQAFRAVLAGLNLSTRVQRVSGEGLADEELEDMELFQHFGFTSAPPPGTEYIALPLGGRTSASVVVATEHGAVRFVLDNQGESCVYNQWGDFAHFKKDRSIHVKAQEKVFVETKVFRVEASERIEFVSPVFLAQASTSARFETPVVQATQLLQPQQLTIGLSGPGVATMTGGSINYSNVTTTYTGGSITHDGKKVDKTHTHNETGSVTAAPN